MALNSAHSTTLSGLQSAMQRLGGAAQHVAQWRGRVDAAADGAMPAQSNEALAKDMVSQRVALYEFKSNMQVFKAEQEMLGTLLDLRA